jgi:transcription elongation factor Elf1
MSISTALLTDIRIEFDQLPSGQKMALRRALLSYSTVVAAAPVLLLHLQERFPQNKRQWTVFCDDDTAAKDEVAEIVINDDAEADKAWESEKESCSFCNQFLQSPCKNEFRRWSKCVDKAKDMDVDFVKACTRYTNFLMDCTSENVDFFEKWKSDHENDENAVDDEHEGKGDDIAENESSDPKLVQSS